LVVDPYAVLTRSISFQFFQTIARRNPQLLNILSSMQDEQLALRAAHNRGRISTSLLPSKEPFGVSIGKALNHSRP